MMTAQEKQCLRQVLQTLDQRDLQQFDALNDPIPPFSEKFEKKMQELIRASQKATRTTRKTVRKRALFVFCAIFLAFALSLSVSAIREPVFRFFKTIYENSIGFYAQDSNTPKTISEYYTIHEIPTEYDMSENICYDGLNSFRWWKNDQYISFTQATLQSTNLSVSTKDSGGEMMFLRETEIFHITGKGTHTFIWSEDGYSFTLVCPDDLPWEDIVRMIESVRPVSAE